jgi:hypothetical protein
LRNRQRSNTTPPPTTVATVEKSEKGYHELCREEGSAVS